MAGVVVHRMGCFSGTCPVASSADSDDAYYYYDALLMDATGQSDGTGYSAEESRYGETITYGSTAAIASEKFEFNGTSDYITLPDAFKYTPNSAMTWEIFGLVLDAVNTGTEQGILAQYNSSQESWKINEGSGNIGFAISTNGTSAAATVTIPGVSAGEEMDIYISWDGATIRAYKNGAFIDSASFSSYAFNSTATLTAGCELSSGSPYRFMNGRFTAARMTRGLGRYTTETGCQYRPKMPLPSTQATTTDTYWDDVTLLMSGTGTDTDTAFVDESPYDFPAFAQGNAQTDTTITLQGANTMLFDGTGDYIDVTESAQNQHRFGSSDFTIDVAVRFTSVSTGAIQDIVNLWDDATNNKSWRFYLDSDGTTLAFRWSTDGSTNTGTFTYSWTPSIDTEYHLRVVRDGSNVRFWIDGTYISAAAISGTLYAANETLRIGDNSGSTTGPFTGYMSELRITNGTARSTGTSNYTDPTTPWDRG